MNHTFETEDGTVIDLGEIQAIDVHSPYGTTYYKVVLRGRDQGVQIQLKDFNKLKTEWQHWLKFYYERSLL